MTIKPDCPKCKTGFLAQMNNGTRQCISCDYVEKAVIVRIIIGGKKK